MSDPLIPADESALTPLVQMPEIGAPDEVLEQPLDDLAFDERHREDFVGLLHLGKLEMECRVAGHRFLLRTPSQPDRLAMGPLHKEWLNTLTAERAWMLVTVAAYTRRIDTEVAPEPLNQNITALRTRFDWIMASIYNEQIVERVYSHCMLLDARTRELIDQLDELGKD